MRALIWHKNGEVAMKEWKPNIINNNNSNSICIAKHTSTLVVVAWLRDARENVRAYIGRYQWYSSVKKRQIDFIEL